MTPRLSTTACACLLLMAGAAMPACSSDGGAKNISRQGLPAIDPAGEPAPSAQSAAEAREAEARRIAAMTLPGVSEQLAMDPEVDVWALGEDMFPEPVPRTPQSAVLYEPVEDKILHFAGTMLRQDEVLVEYSEALGEELRPAGLAAWFTLSGTRGWEMDLQQLNRALESAKETGGLLNLALSFSGEVRGGGAVSDHAVASTTEWDERIDTVADIIRDSEVRVLLRIGNEINGWQGHHPGVFPAAYRKIVDRFRERGADNVAFVWCMAAHGDPDIFGRSEDGQWRWWPGEDYIDWYSVNVFDRLHFSGLSARGREDADKYSSVTDELLAHARRVGKPVLIGECTPQRMDVVSEREDPRGERGEVVWEQWFLPFLAFLDQHPEIKGVTMLPVDWRKTSAWQDWGDARIQRNPTIISRWRDELSRTRWLHLPDVLGDTQGVLGTRHAQERAPGTPFQPKKKPKPLPKSKKPSGGRQSGRGG